ncbi:porin OmpC [Acerihabitans sp.]|uniref:porin OmpC n=1 Tax=Acerihabitans sp. TaxID=2811394 RepID=UPI002ED973BD
MKTSYLWLVLPLVFIAGNASAAEIINKDGNKLDLYGKVDTLHMFSDNPGIDGDQTYFRFGFRGQTQINSSLTGYGQWEYQVNANQAESASSTSVTRLGFAGLRTQDYGSVDYGRNFGVLYDLGAWTDVIPEFGGDAYGIDNFMFKRTSNLLTYRNNVLVDGLKLTAQYQGKNGSATETNNGRDALRQNGEGYGAALIYDFGAGISAGATFTSSDRTEGQNNLAYGHGDKADAYRGALKYDANQIYLAATYTETYNATPFGSSGHSVYGFANKAQVVELLAQYQFTNGLAPIVSYLQTRSKNIEGYGNQDSLKYLAVGGAYFFNKRMSTDVIYKVNLLKNNDFTKNSGINTDDVLAVALIYYF